MIETGLIGVRNDYQHFHHNNILLVAQWYENARRSTVEDNLP